MSLKAFLNDRSIGVGLVKL